jgi:hypothetical protein
MFCIFFLFLIVEIGEETLADGSTYNGDWQNGKRHGQGMRNLS